MSVGMDTGGVTCTAEGWGGEVGEVAAAAYDGEDADGDCEDDGMMTVGTTGVCRALPQVRHF